VTRTQAATGCRSGWRRPVQRSPSTRALILVLALTVLLPTAAFAGDDASTTGASGSICVAPLPLDVKAQDKQNPSFRQFSYRFAIQVDSRKPVEMTRKSGIRIEELDLTTRHVVRIWDGRTVVESFRFTFAERGGTDLCLWYRAGRQTWILEPPHADHERCRCTEKATPPRMGLTP